MNDLAPQKTDITRKLPIFFISGNTLGISRDM
jgi:hypothetical protein